MSISAGYMARYADKELESLLECYGAVQVRGPKYCGKTRTATEHASSVFALDDADNNYYNYRMAQLDPRTSLVGEEPHLIDEWQLIPAVWDLVRRDVDKTNRSGHYILCGSSTPKDPNGVPGISPPLHSGFGRIASMKMRTMSLAESGESDLKVSLKSLFEGGLAVTQMERRDLEWVIDMVMGGGWPGTMRLPLEKRIEAVSRYPEEICESDLPRVDGSKAPSTMKMILRSLARNESTLVSARALSRDIKEYEDDTIKDSTISDYIRTLDRMNLIENQPAFDPNLRSSVRVGKTPKRHLTDPALSVAAMHLSREMLASDLKTLGFMFEALCERDLQIYAQANGGSLFHYRDASGREIDAVVELPDRRWGAFEIRLGTGQIDAAAENLLRIDNMIRNDECARPPSVLCVVSGLEGAAYRREDGVCVVPIGSLRAR